MDFMKGYLPEMLLPNTNQDENDKNGKYLVRTMQLQGARKYQEDTYFKETINGVYCAGVFDGHAGGECSKWVMERCRILLHKYIRALYLEDFFLLLTNMIAYKRWRRTNTYTRLAHLLEKRPFGKTAGMVLLLYSPNTEKKLHDIKRFLFNLILRKIVQEVNLQWDSYSAKLMVSGTKDNYNRSISGTTLLLCIITSSDIHITWLGDSRCIYKTDKHAFGYTIDHKPNQADFVSNKCFILRGRLNGILAVGRTIGDNTHELIGCINRKPSQQTIEYDKCFRVILATDGLYDMVPMETIIQSQINTLRGYAYHDNMTVISIEKK